MYHHDGGLGCSGFLDIAWSIWAFLGGGFVVCLFLTYTLYQRLGWRWICQWLGGFGCHHGLLTSFLFIYIMLALSGLGGTRLGMSCGFELDIYDIRFVRYIVEI